MVDILEDEAAAKDKNMRSWIMVGGEGREGEREGVC